MRKRKSVHLLIVLIAAMTVGCGGRGPQRPSFRSGSEPEVDSAQLALMALNQHLAQTADQEVRIKAQAQEEQYALYESGAWGHVFDYGNTSGPSPQRGETWTVHMRVYSLDGKLYSDIIQEMPIGQYELPLAIEASISEWHRGARVRMIAPWYAAYGMQGKEGVPPYENVIIDFELK